MSGAGASRRLRAAASWPTLARVSLGLRTRAVLALLLLGCGGGPSAEGEQSAARSEGGEAALPALPSDPLALLPAGAQLVLTVDLKALRASPHFATLRRWVERETCTPASTDHLLFDRAERIVLGGMPDPAQPDELRPLALVRVKAAAGDASQLLDQHRALLGKPPLRAAEIARGRHAYVEAEGTAAARLGDQLLVVGDAAQVAAVLATADGKQPAFPSGDAQATALRDQGWYASHTIALGGRVSERGAKRMRRSLSGVGASGAVAPLERGTLALAVDLDTGARAQAQLDLPDPATAHQAADSLRSSFGKLSLILTLTGLPAALANPNIRVEGNRLSLDLALPADDVRTILDRLEGLIGGSTPPCMQHQAARDTPATHGES